MDLQTAMTIGGLLATVVFGLLSIFVAIYLVRRSRYPARVTFVEVHCLGLFDAIVRNISELRVTYNDQPVGEDLVLLKGFLVNTGWKDITPDMVEQRLTLELPPDYEWLRAVASSPHAEISTQIVNDSQELVFDIGLFRRNEYIEFEALAEVPSRQQVSEKEGDSAASRLRRDMSFRHRISDTQTVEERSLIPHSTDRRRYVARKPIRITRPALSLFIVAIGMGVMGLISWITGEEFLLELDTPVLIVFLVYLFTGVLMVVGDYVFSRRDDDLRKLLSIEDNR